MAGVLAAVFKRLYLKGEITKDEVTARVVSGKISAADYLYITGEAYHE